MKTDTITRMREHLEEHGWWQGDLHQGHEVNSAACLQGAFNVAWDYRPESPDIQRSRKETGARLAAAITGLYPDFRCCTEEDHHHLSDWHLIVCFNDDEHTTVEDIMRVLKHVERQV